MSNCSSSAVLISSFVWNYKSHIICSYVVDKTIRCKFSRILLFCKLDCCPLRITCYIGTMTTARRVCMWLICKPQGMWQSYTCHFFYIAHNRNQFHEAVGVQVHYWVKPLLETCWLILSCKTVWTPNSESIYSMASFETSCKNVHISWFCYLHCDI